jgi:uncharacterized protein
VACAVPALRQRLRETLTVAMKTGDRVAVAALRTTLAAIDNAEVAASASAAPGQLAIEQLPYGVGVTDVERRALVESEVELIVRAEVAEREAAARDYDQASNPPRSETRVLST